MYRTRRSYRAQEYDEFKIQIPKQFSFITNPKGTTEFFKGLKRRLTSRKPYHFIVDHHETIEIDLAASFLFDELMREQRDYWKQHRIGLRFSGKISQKKSVNNFLLSYGLLEMLGISSKNFSPNIVDNDYKDKYFTLKMSGSKRVEYHKGVASVHMVDYFNRCLNHNGYEIDKTIKSNLIDSFGEIIGNAEEHCGDRHQEWYALGCYDKEEHVCSFAIINHGRTIYENLSDSACTAAEVLHKISSVIAQNRPLIEKAYGFITARHEEPIWNVMALQDGISSRRTETGQSSSRGQGIMDVLSFIDQTKSENKGATISLISGHSGIIIDYTYPLFFKEVGHLRDKRRVIVFNKEKDLHRSSDPKKVMFLEDKFDGTIFAGAFKIDEKHLRQKINEQ